MALTSFLWSSGYQPKVRDKSQGLLQIFISLRLTLGFSMKMSHIASSQLTWGLGGTRKEKGWEPLL